MLSFLPTSFIQALAGLFSLFAIVAFILSFFKSIRTHSLRLFAIMLIGAIALFSNNVWVSFASVFIIATAITETEFLQNLAAIIRGSKHYFDYKAALAGEITPPEKTIILLRDPMEYKILNTLWTKQVNKFPTFSPLFTFVIPLNSPEYFQFRKAGSKLIGESFVGETDTGYYHLTHNGWNWCKKHYGEFPADQWWPEETINKENLEKVLNIT